jgi:hypothetical protein
MLFGEYGDPVMANISMMRAVSPAQDEIGRFAG